MRACQALIITSKFLQGKDNILHIALPVSHAVLFSVPTCEHAQELSRVQLFGTLWTVAHQAPLSMGFSKQEYWSGLPFPSPGALPNSGIKPGSPTLQVDSLLLSHQGSPAV